MIEEAKEKGKMWQAAKSYLTDNMFCYKLGLSHESNMHQIQNHGMNSLANEMNSSINMK